MKYINIFFAFAGVWFVASVINGLLSGISLLLAGSINEPGLIWLCIIFSFIFSTPLVAGVWLIATIAYAAGKTGFALFKITVIATLVFAIIGAIFFIAVFKNEFKSGSYAVGASVIFAALTAVTVFHKQIKGHETTV
jgi:hypothetical protein